MWLQSNKIETIDSSTFDGLEKLEYLGLYENEIKQLNKDTFKHLVSLKVIELSGNNIESIDSSTFDGLEKLEELWLNNNKLFVRSHLV